jgi:hypothetical protein
MNHYRLALRQSAPSSCSLFNAIELPQLAEAANRDDGHEMPVSGVAAGG